MKNYILAYSMDRDVVFKGKTEVARTTIQGNIILLCLFAIQISAVYLTMWSQDLLSHFKPSLYGNILFLSLFVVVFVKGISYALMHYSYDDGERGLSRVKSDFLSSWLTVDYMAAFLLPMILLPTFLSLYSSMKSIIHLVQPFYLDEFLMRADRFIHFGVDPWRITHSIFGTAIASVVLNFIYNLWFFIMYSYVLWMIVNVRFGRDRMQFLFAFVIIWPLIGSLIAVGLSSAGPVYYGDVVGDSSIFGPLMEALKQYNGQFKDSPFGIFALNTQDMLWADYLKNDTNIGSGISAMPSMHVAIATLLYLSGRQVSKYIGYGMLVFLILIQIGSVHLGWHYALDGYLSILLTWAIWKFCGWMVDRIYGEEDSSATDNALGNQSDL